MSSLSNCFCACTFDEVIESEFGFKRGKLEKVILSPSSTLVYDLLLPPYDRVSRCTQKAVETRLEAVKLVFFFEAQNFEVLKSFLLLS